MHMQTFQSWASQQSTLKPQRNQSLSAAHDYIHLLIPIPVVLLD